jgi:hypothetical protein
MLLSERHVLHPRLILGLLAFLLCVGCRTAKQDLFTVSGPGWQVRQGQALWRPRHGFPELGGDIVLASHTDGRCVIQFAKTPISLLSAQTSGTNWLIQFPAGDLAFAGRRRPPTRFAWLYLPAALAGESVPAPLKFEEKPDGGWRLENKRTGETIEGFLAP